MNNKTITLSKEPYIPYKDWTVEYHNHIDSFDPSQLSLHLEPEQEKGYIKGEVLAERMKERGLNSNVLQYLYEHQELIPESWKGKWVYFWGTIYRDAGGRLFVRCLRWDGGGWGWRYYWLVNDWYDDGPAAVSAISTQNSDSQPSSGAMPFELPKILTINGVTYTRDE